MTETPDDAQGIVLDRYGDPAPDPKSVRMIEKESYERVIEGLRMAAEAAMHLAATEPQLCGIWTSLARKLDLVRRGAVQRAGLEDTIRQRATEQVWGNPLPWRSARDRFREGLRQASGGARQLAVCFRADLSFHQMAEQLDAMGRKLNRPPRRRLVLPPGFH